MGELIEKAFAKQQEKLKEKVRDETVQTKNQFGTFSVEEEDDSSASSTTLTPCGSRQDWAPPTDESAPGKKFEEDAARQPGKTKLTAASSTEVSEVIIKDLVWEPIKEVVYMKDKTTTSGVSTTSTGTSTTSSSRTSATLPTPLYTAGTYFV